MGLGELWLAARAAGLDPRAVYGEMSRRADVATAEMLAGFEHTAHFAEAVRGAL